MTRDGPEDPLLHELIGYIYLMLGKEEESLAFFAKADLEPTSFAIDWIEGRCEAKSIALLFKKEEKTRDKMIAYRKEIEKMLESSANF